MGILIEKGMEYGEVSRELLGEFTARPSMDTIFNAAGVVLVESISYVEAVLALLL